MADSNNHRLNVDNLHVHPELVSRKRKVPCGVFWHLNIFEIVTEKTDDYIQAIRKEIKSDWKEEMFICFTDVKKTPEELIKRLLENQVTIIQHEDTKDLCLVKHFWRFTSNEKENLKVLLPAVDSENNILKEDLNKHMLTECDVCLPSLDTKPPEKEIVDKTLVLSNYPPNIPSDCLRWIMANLLSQVNSIANIPENNTGFGTKHFYINFEREIDLSLVLKKLQNRLLLLIQSESAVESQASNITEEDPPGMEYDPPTAERTSVDTDLNQLPETYHRFLKVTDTTNDVQHEMEEVPTNDDTMYQEPEIDIRYLFKEEKIETIIMWDIQNCSVRADYVRAYVNEIRKQTITPGYYEQAFVCIDNVYKAADETIQAFSELGVTFVHLPTENKQTADKCFIDLMESFSSNRREKARIVLISGDSDYGKIIKRIKTMDRNSVYLVHSQQSRQHFISLVDTRDVHEEIKEKLKPTKIEKNNHSALPGGWEKKATEYGVLMKFNYTNTCEEQLLLQTKEVTVYNKSKDPLTRTNTENLDIEQWEKNKYGKKPGKYHYYILICDNKDKAKRAYSTYGRCFYCCKLLNVSSLTK